MTNAIGQVGQETAETARPRDPASPIGGRVLVASELHERGDRAVRWARNLAIGLGVPLDVDVPMMNASTEHDPDTERMFENQTVDLVRNHLDDEGVDADSVIVIDGDFEAGIVGAAEPGDLVVIGVRHHEGATRWALGSRPHELAHRLRCPLVLVPPLDRTPDDGPVVVGVDGSDQNRVVVDWAKAIAAALGRPVEAVYAPDAMYDTFDNAGDYGDEERKARLEAEMEGVPLLERSGEPDQVLREFAQEQRAALTVVGARGAMLGRVVDHLVHTPPGAIAIVTHGDDETTATDQDAESRDAEMSEHTKDVLRTLHRVVVPTDASGEAMARARAAARRLASRYGFEVVLYDRSHESWTISPHAQDLLGVDDVDAGERPHLVAQMREFIDAGVTVWAYLAIVPSITAITDAIQEHGVDGVMVPEHLEHPKLMDRLQSTHSRTADLVEHIITFETDSRPTVLVVPDQGPVAAIELATGH